MKGLIVAEPWISLILEGRKTWEMRSRDTRVRGQIGLIRKGSKSVVGVAELVGTLPHLPMPLERHAIGTDFALQFARTVFCARLPIAPAMIDQVITFLNDKNREYAEGKTDYNWSVWADNCVHTCEMRSLRPIFGRRCRFARSR